MVISASEKTSRKTVPDSENAHLVQSMVKGNTIQVCRDMVKSIEVGDRVLSGEFIELIIGVVVMR